MFKRIIATLLAAGLAAGLAACGGDPAENSSVSPQSSSPAASTPAITGMKIGETGTSISTTVTVTDAGTADDGTFYVDITIENVGLINHELSISQRFHLLNAQREKVTVKSFTADDGTDQNGKLLTPGQKLSGRAVFELPEGFTVAAFTYTYDINGFGLFTYLIES